MFDILRSSSLETIEQRFFIRGHDSNSCNRCFDKINTKRKIVNSIFVPDDWVNIISTLDVKSTFSVTKMTKNEFYSAQKLLPFAETENVPTIDQISDWSKVESIIINRTKNRTHTQSSKKPTSFTHF